ncbi:MAG: hypothetical protein EBW69_07065, partial [Nitrosomonadales bacterium]|nr:hypothetical protein [Nitrosomonadales bacterium]
NKKDESYDVLKSINENKLDDGIKQFEKSEKLAQHPADQLLAIMFKGLAYKEKNDLNQAFNVFNTGYETAKLGNSKFVQFERRFLIQMGNIQESLKKHEDAYESYAKSLKASSNDEERAESYDKLARSASHQKYYDRAREYSLKGSVLYKKTGYLGEYAELTLLKAEYEVLDDAYDLAMNTLEELEKLCIDAGGEYYLVKTYIQLHKLSKDNKDAYLAKATDVANRIGAKDLLNDI